MKQNQTVKRLETHDIESIYYARAEIEAPYFANNANIIIVFNYSNANNKHRI